MNDDQEGKKSNPPGSLDDEQDEPLAVLNALAEETSPEFVNRVRVKIHRKVVTSQLASFWWEAPRVVFAESWSVLTWLMRWPPRRE